MTKPLQKASFESRINKQSRRIPDESGGIRYQHNERLAESESVKMADGGQEGTVAEAGLIDLLGRHEMVVILVNGERIKLAESAVYRA